MPDERGKIPVHGADPGDPGDTPLGRAVMAYLAGDLGPVKRLPDEDRALVLDVGPWLVALRSSAPPAAAPANVAVPELDQDPIAIALGLVPDPDRALAASRLREARRRARLKRSELVQRLVARGWEVSVVDIAVWEHSDTAQSPALVSAVADILRTSLVTLMPHRSSAPASRWSGILDDETIIDQLEAWAEEAGVESAVLRRKVEHTLAGAFHRNQQEPTVPALRRVIDVLRRIPGFLDRT
jgi:transcriptional regulator with XRE-family HTH domain